MKKNKRLLWFLSFVFAFVFTSNLAQLEAADIVSKNTDAGDGSLIVFQDSGQIEKNPLIHKVHFTSKGKIVKTLIFKANKKGAIVWDDDGVLVSEEGHQGEIIDSATGEVESMIFNKVGDDQTYTFDSNVDCQEEEIVVDGVQTTATTCSDEGSSSGSASKKRYYSYKVIVR